MQSLLGAGRGCLSDIAQLWGSRISDDVHPHTSFQSVSPCISSCLCVQSCSVVQLRRSLRACGNNHIRITSDPSVLPNISSSILIYVCYN